MSAVMQFLETTFGRWSLSSPCEPGGHGPPGQDAEVAAALRNKKSLALIFVWGWVVGRRSAI